MRHVVWLDLEQLRVSDEELRAACRAGAHIHLTVTTRGLRGMTHSMHQANVEAQMHRVGLKRVEVSKYLGKGNRYMIHAMGCGLE